MLKSLDWELSVSLANGDEDTAEMLLEMMREQLPEFKVLLLQSFETHHIEDLIRHAHKLHGGCCYCGVPQLKKLIRSLEIQAKEQPPALDPNLFHETIAEIDQVIECLNRKDYRS